jgi:MFS transporter, SP family, sugar:H+ symporter
MKHTLRVPKINRDTFSFSTHVHYDKYNPNSEAGTDVRHSLAGLDYSPLRRVTWRSFNMGVLISMGGFM